MQMSGSQIVGLLAVLIIVAGIVAIAALIINAIVRVKLAKYKSIQPAVKEEGVWPPAPSVTPFLEPTPARSSPTLPKREGEE